MIEPRLNGASVTHASMPLCGDRNHRCALCPPGNHKGQVELLIPSTGERNVYTLTGKGTEPLAEGHIIVETQVGGTDGFLEGLSDMLNDCMTSTLTADIVHMKHQFCCYLPGPQGGVEVLPRA